MPSYKNEKCPVCNTEFKDGDDIVTCPVCGTPHHRECYNKIGHCINEDKHKEALNLKKLQLSRKSQRITKVKIIRHSAHTLYQAVMKMSKKALQVQVKAKTLKNV